MYTVYCLYSKKFEKIYIGYTADLIDRFRSPNVLATKGYSVRYRPWIVAYVEFCTSKPDAIKREKEMKTVKERIVIWDYIHTHYNSHKLSDW